MKAFWQLLAALFPDDPTEANYPAVPGGQVIALGTDGVARWSLGTGGGGEPLVDDAAGEILFDDATGDILMDG
jgi:hypothetical protein